MVLSGRNWFSCSSTQEQKQEQRREDSLWQKRLTTFGSEKTENLVIVVWEHQESTERGEESLECPNKTKRF
jgi:hypothetical protein